MKEKIKPNAGKIFWIVLLSFLAALALASIIHMFLTGSLVGAIINSIIICIIFAIIFFISRFSIRMMSLPNASSMSIENQPSDFSYLCTRDKVKKVFIGLIPLLVCLGASGLLGFFMAKNIKLIKSDQYVATRAKIVYVYNNGDGYVSSTTIHTSTSRLVYEYQDENGKTHYSSSQASYGGMIFKAGKTTTVYYSRENPEILISPSQAIFLALGMLFFANVGLMAFFGSLGIGNKVIPIVFGSVFIEFSSLFMYGMVMASGMNIFEIMVSGAAPYALTLFALLGLFVFGYGVVTLVKSIALSIKRKNCVKEGKDKALSDLAEKPARNVASHKSTENKKVKKEKVPRYFDPKEIVKMALVVGLIFAIAGASVMVGVGIIPLARSASYVKVEATVVKINTLTNSSGDQVVTYEYEYVFNGEKYHKKTSFSQSVELAPLVGEKITVRVNKNDPEDVLDANFTSWIMLFVGLLFLGIGVGCCIFSIKPAFKTYPAGYKEEVEKMDNKISSD